MISITTTLLSFWIELSSEPPRFQGQWLESCFYTDPLSSTYELENNLDDNSKILLTPLQLQSETTNWIEEYYNLNRRHSSNDYLSPIDYENRSLKSSNINEQAS